MYTHRQPQLADVIEYSALDVQPTILPNMLQERDSIDRMRVASPCPMNWEAMTGDDRTRYCSLCNLHVYNISEMTRQDVNQLIATTEGRICARLYKRTDGTVITKDCPVGLRAIRRRVSKVVGATATAILSLCMNAIGKPGPFHGRATSGEIKVLSAGTNTLRQHDRAEISGRVLDQNGAVIESASVTIVNKNTGRTSKTETSAEGKFNFNFLPSGIYTIKIESAYFSPYESSDIKLGASDTLNENITLIVMGAMVGVIVLDEPTIDTTGPATKKVFTEKQIRSLPY